MNGLEIRQDDLTGAAIQALLHEHLANMREVSPPESVHALDLDALRQPAITFWTAWRAGTLLGCGALKDLGGGHGEIKSMRTPNAHRGLGTGKAMLRHILHEAGRRGFTRLSLETGSMAAFAPAHALYASHGFEPCAPFAGYAQDPNSLFMTRAISPAGTRRLAVPADLDDVFAIYMHESTVPFLGIDACGKEEFQREYDRLLATGCFHVWESSGEVLGFYRASFHPGRARHVAGLGTLAVAPQAQGSGVARAMVGDAIERLRAEGAHRIELLVEADNLRAQAFYERLGFQREGRMRDAYQRAGEPGYVDEIPMALLFPAP